VTESSVYQQVFTIKTASDTWAKTVKGRSGQKVIKLIKPQATLSIKMLMPSSSINIMRQYPLIRPIQNQC